MEGFTPILSTIGGVLIGLVGMVVAMVAAMVAGMYAHRTVDLLAGIQTPTGAVSDG